MDAVDLETRALIDLGEALRAAGYRFVSVTPETHRRVEARARAAGKDRGASLRDVFGWSRAFSPDALVPTIVDLARRANVFHADGDLLRSSVRFSSIGEDIFVHSAYPTVAPDAVFFGPDTYRFCDLLRAEAAGGASRIVDIGCGSGAGGIVAGRDVSATIVLADVNPGALRLARVNATLAGVSDRTETVESDVLASVTGAFDLVIANPPYMVDPGARAYRDGGGSYGEELAVRIARETIARLRPGARLVLYTGAAVVDGTDTFLEAVRPVCDVAHASWRYRELDPDVFGEEIEHNEAYATVERIAAVALVVTGR